MRLMLDEFRTTTGAMRIVIKEKDAMFPLVELNIDALPDTKTLRKYEVELMVRHDTHPKHPDGWTGKVSRVIARVFK